MNATAKFAAISSIVAMAAAQQQPLERVVPGSACQPYADDGEFVAFDFMVQRGGLRNGSTDPRLVVCPLTTGNRNPHLRDRIAYNWQGSVSLETEDYSSITCTLYKRNWQGELLQDTTKSTDAGVGKHELSFFSHGRSGDFLYLLCELPPGAKVVATKSKDM